MYSAVGDAFAGRPLGFGRRRAALAARFARHRGAADDAVAANWVAGALAEIGLLETPRTPNGMPALFAAADVPLRGAHVVASLPGLPASAADIVRWHREHDDGTGVPDGLRWDGIPADAGALGIAHAFLEALDESRDPVEALFTIGNEAGRRFGIDRVRMFRALVLGTPDGWDAPIELRLPALDADAALQSLAARLDARDPASNGRTERLAALAADLAGRAGEDTSRAGRVARLLALGTAGNPAPEQAFDPLSRFAREQRTAVAERAAAIAASVPAYRDDAPALAASARWYEDGQPDRVAAVVAVALAALALPASDAPARLTAASGTQLDPDVTRAYVAGLGPAR